MAQTQEKTSLEAIVSELLKDGNITLTAKTRQDIYEQSDKIVGLLPEGTRWSRTICKYHPETFSFSQNISINKN